MDDDDCGDLYGDLDCHVSDKEGVEIKPKPEEPSSNRQVETLKSKEERNFEEDDGSNSDWDDDDDFRIVLNENEFPKFQFSKGGVNGIDEDDDCDKIADCINNNQPMLSSADDLKQGSDTKGIAKNGDQRLGRHIGSHFKGFPRASLYGRGARDNHLMPCIQGSVSYNRDFSVAAQTGAKFCLPRNRTIYDINIEAFEQKPWRHHGVDITDYFNFGLNEESWKSYCESLDRLKKEAMIFNGSPINQSSRLNQPKGRAIQVESSLCERMPSTDKWFPRARDSDVVIQIKMEGSAQGATIFCKNSSECAENIGASVSTSGNNSSKRVLSPHNDSQICREITNSVENYSPHSNLSNFRGACRTTNSNVDYEKDEEKDPVRKNEFMSGLGSDSGEQVPHCSTSCNLPSHSEEFKDVINVGDDTRLTKKASVKELQDYIESDHYLSHDSISDATEPEQDEVRECALSSGEYNHFSRTRLKSVAELNVAEDDNQSATCVRRKHQNDMDLGNIRCKTRKRKSNYDSDDFREHLYSYRETEVSLSYKSRRHAVKCDSHKSFTRDSRERDLITYSGRHWDEEDWEQRDCGFSERHHEDRGRRCSLHEYPDQPNFENKFLFKEKNSRFCMTKERVDEHWTSMDSEYNDVIHDHRYREHYVQDMHGRLVDPYDVEEEGFDLGRNQYFYFTDGTIRSPERSRYHRRLNFEKNKSNKYMQNDADQRLVDRRYEEPFKTDERDWCDASSPREHSCISWRSSGRYMKHRGHIRDLQFKYKTNGCDVSSIKDQHHSSYEDNLKSNLEPYNSEEDIYYENIVPSVQMRRHNGLQKSNLNAHDDDSRLRHFEQENLPARGRFLLERNLKCDIFPVRKHFLYGQRLLGDRLYNDRKRRVVETSNSDVREHVNVVPHMARNELEAVGCREAVNKDLNGFKEKLTRRGIGVAEKSEKAIGTGYKGRLLKNSRKIKETYKPEEICSHISKLEGSHNHQTRLRVDKTNDSLDKILVSKNSEDNEIEEGELIEESDKQDVVSSKKDWNSGKKLEDCSNNGKIAGIYDNSHILQTLAKMEKRKERFKEPIASKQGLEKNIDTKVDVSVVSNEIKQQRPARKRRWGGN